MAAEMKTDAYMKCRGAGRIGGNPRPDGPTRQARCVLSLWVVISSQVVVLALVFFNFLIHKAFLISSQTWSDAGLPDGSGISAC